MSEIEVPPPRSSEPLNSTNQQNNDGQFKTADPWRIIEICLTICIFISYIVLGVVGYFQFDAARKAARRAMQANQIAKKALTESNKAFVYVSSVTLEPNPLPTDLPSILNGQGEIIVGFANSGNTPALRFMPEANFICTNRGQISTIQISAFNHRVTNLRFLRPNKKFSSDSRLEPIVFWAYVKVMHL